MKLAIEGSAADLKEFMSDKDIAYFAAKNEAKAEQTANQLKRLKENSSSKEETEAKAQIAAYQAKLNDKERQELLALRDEVNVKHLSWQRAEAEILQLKEYLRNPVRLTPVQEAELEALFQEHLRIYGQKPEIFVHKEGVKITMDQAIRQIFEQLASGNRVKAIVTMRAVSDLGLKASKELVENALLAHGVVLTRANLKGNTTEVVHPPLLLRENNNVATS